MPGAHEQATGATALDEPPASAVAEQNGAVVAEVVLTPEGPEEAALYDQTESVPQAVGDCLGNALGAVGWPLPTTEQAVAFPIVGGIQ